MVCITSTRSLLPAELAGFACQIVVPEPTAVVVVNPEIVTKSPTVVDPVPVVPPVWMPGILLKSTEMKSMT